MPEIQLTQVQPIAVSVGQKRLQQLVAAGFSALEIEKVTYIRRFTGLEGGTTWLCTDQPIEGFNEIDPPYTQHEFENFLELRSKDTCTVARGAVVGAVLPHWVMAIVKHNQQPCLAVQWSHWDRLKL